MRLHLEQLAEKFVMALEPDKCSLHLDRCAANLVRGKTGSCVEHCKYREPYGATMREFLVTAPDAIIGALVNGADFAVETAQRNAWQQQILILKDVLADCSGRGAVYFEFAIPRLGKRVDTILILGHVLFVLEFKVGERQHTAGARDQTWDYALDLKNFHEPSHAVPIAPVIVATEAKSAAFVVATTHHTDQLLKPLFAGRANLRHVIDASLNFLKGVSTVELS